MYRERPPWSDSITHLRRRQAKKYVDFAVDVWTVCGHVDTLCRQKG
jgi:hypothetical protein